MPVWPDGWKRWHFSRNSTESGGSRVQSEVAAGAKYGEFSSGEKSRGFSPEKRRSNLIMPTTERSSISSCFSQYSFLANPCQIISSILYCIILYIIYYIILIILSRWNCSVCEQFKPFSVDDSTFPRFHVSA